VFDNLTRIEHANIVKFHRYWVDPPKKDSQKTRVVFITEYMSSGSVKKFLNKTKEVQKSKSSKSWKRWCRQILSALGYLHMCDPPIVHGNLTCDTIFIQHNGLLKIGSVAPDAIRNHVKTYREIHKNLHYFAPECTGEGTGQITPAVDIYSFGICCLEMAMPKTHLPIGENKRVGEEDIEKAIALLEDPQQQHFIKWCISKDPDSRPRARTLLLHPVLHHVPSLKLVAAHIFVKNLEILSENHLETQKTKMRNKTEVMITTKDKEMTRSDFPAFDIDKYLEDVRVGIYPLTTFQLPQPPKRTRGESESELENGQVANVPNPQEPLEIRKILTAEVVICPAEEKECDEMIIHIRFEDKTNRQLRVDVAKDDSPEKFVEELYGHNFIAENDKGVIQAIIEDAQQQSNKMSLLTVGQYNVSKQAAEAATAAEVVSAEAAVAAAVASTESAATAPTVTASSVLAAELDSSAGANGDSSNKLATAAAAASVGAAAVSLLVEQEPQAPAVAAIITADMTGDMMKSSSIASLDNNNSTRHQLNINNSNSTAGSGGATTSSSDAAAASSSVGSSSLADASGSSDDAQVASGSGNDSEAP